MANQAPVRGPWPQGVDPSPLGPGEVHLWWKELGHGIGPDAGSDDRALHPEECRRAHRFRKPADGRAWAECRAWLRRVLSSYLGCEPYAVSFSYGPEGKPFLQDSPRELDFNLSHSGARALLAVAWREVGVDIEEMAGMEPTPELEDGVFSDLELKVLRSASQRDRKRLFYKGWTRKEALLKASGRGLSLSPVSVGVLTSEVESAQPVRLSREPWMDEFHSYTLWDLEPEEGIAGAVAVAMGQPVFRCRRWRD